MSLIITRLTARFPRISALDYAPTTSKTGSLLPGKLAEHMSTPSQVRSAGYKRPLLARLRGRLVQIAAITWMSFEPRARRSTVAIRKPRMRP